MKNVITKACAAAFLICSTTQTFAQQTNNEDTDHLKEPYKINWKVDAPVTAVLIGASVYGHHLAGQKDGFDSLDIVRIDEAGEKRSYLEKINVNDRNADKITDGLFGSGFLVPLVLFAAKPIRQDAATVGMLYLEAFAFTGAAYGLSVGLVDKARPYAYSPEVAFKRRTSHRAQYSFFAGHTAVTATGAFLTAKIFSDYYPESNFKYVLWGAATAATLTSGYYRYMKGYHFPEDIAVGIGVGALSGILIPHLHKVKSDRMTIMPMTGKYNGLAMNYKF